MLNLELAASPHFFSSLSLEKAGCLLDRLYGESSTELQTSGLVVSLFFSNYWRPKPLGCVHGVF